MHFVYCRSRLSVGWTARTVWIDWVSCGSLLTHHRPHLLPLLASSPLVAVSLFPYVTAMVSTLTALLAIVLYLLFVSSR